MTTNHLKAMGYRELGISKKWAKPVGFSLLVFDLNLQEWTVYFKSHRGDETLVWVKEKYEQSADTDPTEWLSHVEVFSHRDIIGNQKSWAFLDMHERDFC